MVWNIFNSLDVDTAKSVSLEERVPSLELSAITEHTHRDNVREDIAGTGFCDSLQQVVDLLSPRIIKTHLAIDMLPKEVLEKKAKLIYVCRNPRDAVVSFYNHLKVLEGFTGSFETFFKNMKKNAAVNKEDVFEVTRKMTGAEKGSFMRKGATGDWRNHLSDSQLEGMISWENKHLSGSDFQFTFEL